MSTPLPSSVQLAESPELAILYALHSALRAAEHALLAAHPELEEVDLSSALLPVSPMASAADLLLLHLAGSGAAINRYVAQLRRRPELGCSDVEF
jgi:hypothetical protein